MRIVKAEYLLSAPDLGVCPEDGKPEICFAGRSNVGKSSVINALTRRKKLAHTSNSPGKTRSLNYYLIDDSWYLVDMPGYGYAKISKKEQARWGREMKRYLLERQTLQLVVVLLDIRHKPSSLDEEFLFWLGEHQIPFCIVLNKSDKISKNRASQQENAVARLLHEMNIEVPVFAVTANNPDSLDDFFHFAMDFVQESG
jgi:GTP-binding protein